jgi:hypothetical protein
VLFSIGILQQYLHTESNCCTTDTNYNVSPSTIPLPHHFTKNTNIEKEIEVIHFRKLRSAGFKDFSNRFPFANFRFGIFFIFFLDFDFLQLC